MRLEVVMFLLFLGVHILPAALSAGAEPAADRVSRSFTQHILAPPQRVFDLLGPVKESEWADGWKVRMIYPASGEPQKGCIFTVPSEAGETVWTITTYDPKMFEIAYFVVWPGDHTVDIDIVLSKNADDTTAAHLTYTYTALSEAGAKSVAAFTEEKWNRHMTAWETAMNHYLVTGKLLPHHE
ncbi:MAG TPA: hypothetical protein VLR94_12185 [Acidobacteriota bacterium]|nr:hypothetical protein [Acidobacteriota bacterium]